MPDWYGCVKPEGKLEDVQPTVEIVRDAGLHLVPGARLTYDLMGVQDSRGFITKFYLVDGIILCARVFHPDGTCGWMRRNGMVRSA